MDEEIYLGAASFIYILNSFKIRDKVENFSFVTESTIMLWLPKAKSHPFSISGEYRDPTDCGFIITNRITLGKLFSKNDFNTILNDCLRTYNKEKKPLHCPIINDPNRRGNIPTFVDGYEFNCRM